MSDQALLRNEISSLKEKLAQSEAELTIINSALQALASRLEVQAIYDLIGDKIRDIFSAQVVMISTYDPQTATIEHRYAIEQGQRVYAPGHFPIRGFRTQIVQTRQPVLTNTHVAEEAARLGQPTLPGTITPKSWLGVPMLVGDQVTGILSLQNVEQENAFTQSDVRFLQTLAASMSVALENARLWEQEHLYRKALEHEFEIGRDIQASFLPEILPQPKGWEIAASLRSAREVAGDFYDVFELTKGKIGLVIADVCDKGLGAALFMTLFRSLIRVVASIDSYSHAEIAGRFSAETQLKNAILITNNYIAETHGSKGMFATLFFGILDVHTGSLTYINGGHLPPVLINKHGKKKFLTPTGPAVGAIPDAEYVTTKVSFEIEDILFAYTDGLTDTTNPAGDNLSVEELIPLFSGDQALTSVLTEIYKQHELFSVGAQRQDDITLLAVRRKKTDL